ncbi:LIM domain-containing protein PLIM2b isoform X2 [Setaria viridis]|uniref:LIM domain-containing protein PLIM2b isoform X2 n=1 Tax=Setaria viridis TaxID=4556 RepID=UPI0014938C63|nr:LIM domain-containing protein PLIM2b isoform X2 [Setaria viridis]
MLQNLCIGRLQMCSYSSMDGVLYCKTHFEQLFKETGSFSKKFTPGTIIRYDDLVSSVATPTLFVCCATKPVLKILFCNSGGKSADKGELARAPSKLSSAFSGTQDKCAACQKTVYPLEKLTLEGESYHKSCFKCSHGGCILTTSSYAALNGVLYCKIHFGQLFMEKGSYNHMKKKSTSQDTMPDVAAEEQPPEPAPPQEEKGEDN